MLLALIVDKETDCGKFLFAVVRINECTAEETLGVVELVVLKLSVGKNGAEIGASARKAVVQVFGKFDRVP